ncbi:Protein of unknown function, partial [Gryllus bimaculatus]
NREDHIDLISSSNSGTQSLMSLPDQITSSLKVPDIGSDIHHKESLNNVMASHPMKMTFKSEVMCESAYSELPPISNDFNADHMFHLGIDVACDFPDLPDVSVDEMSEYIPLDSIYCLFGESKGNEENSIHEQLDLPENIQQHFLELANLGNSPNNSLADIADQEACL